MRAVKEKVGNRGCCAELKAEGVVIFAGVRTLAGGMCREKATRRLEVVVHWGWGGRLCRIKDGMVRRTVDWSPKSKMKIRVHQCGNIAGPAAIAHAVV